MKGRSRGSALWIVTGAMIAAFVALLLGAEKTSAAPEKSLAEEAQAKGNAPVAAQVQVLKLPGDPSLPKYAVAIKPFEYSASGQQSGGGQGAPSGTATVSEDAVATLSPDGKQIRMTASAGAGPNIGKGIADQLRTALSGWSNISIVPLDAVVKNSDGTYSCKLQPGEIGPFIIEGTVTEFSETADASGKGKRFNAKKLGLATGLIGGIIGNGATAAAGAGVAILGPDFKDAKMNRTGMVGMDLGIQDGRIARYVGGGTFSCQGSFTTVAAASKMDVFGFSSGNGEMAASSLGNATRAALNDAFQKTHDALTTIH